MAVRTASISLLMAVATAAASPGDECCKNPPRTCYSVSSSFTSVAYKSKSFCAELYVPQTSGGAAVAHVPILVVFAHGFLISNRAYKYIVDTLISNGVAVALPRNVNGNFGHDMAAALAVTARLLRPGLEPYSSTSVGSIVVGGHSIGGGAATLAMGQNISLFDAYFSLALQDTTPTAVPNVGWLLAWSGAQCPSRRCDSALTAAASITKPALVIAGSKDVVAVPKKNALPISQAMRSQTTQYVLLEKATHCQFCSSHPSCDILCKGIERCQRVLRGHPFDFDFMPQQKQEDEVKALLVPFLQEACTGVLSTLTAPVASSARHLYRTVVGVVA